MKLEDITKDLNLSGIEPTQIVSVVATVPLGDGSLKVRFKRSGVHILRHTFGAHLAQKGVDVAVIRDLLGHHSVTLTEKYYAHLAPSSLTSAVQRDDVAYFICCFSCKSMF